jgi:hypothetical protein
MITVNPYGGLANRMRVIDSAYQLAKKNNTSIRVIWELTRELNCAFNELFEYKEDLPIKEITLNNFHRRFREGIRRSFQLAGIKYPFGYSKCLYNKEIEELLNAGYNFDDLIRNYPEIFIRTVHLFSQGENSYNEFVPVRELKEKIDSYVSQFAARTVGLHIRRTDNKLSIKHSPISGFLDLMEQYIQEDAGTKFYLATDSPEVEEMIRKKYDGRILSHDKTLDRNTASGIMDSVVDLYCLAYTNRIVGSFYSSFSEVAARINNIELIQVYKK